MTATPCGLTIDGALFKDLVRELARRGGGVRESGAFLLSSNEDAKRDTDTGWVTVTGIVLYDDLDPHCLTGGITFGADGYGVLAEICRKDGVHVVGDIHTHPSGWVGQSLTDAAHPMSALPGHIALIAPRFAQGDVTTLDLGVHVYSGSGRWTSYYKSDVESVLRVTSGGPFKRIARWLRATVRRLADLVRFRRTR
jgi:hypothetical protein